jgi:hypothetical protein
MELCGLWVPSLFLIIYPPTNCLALVTPNQQRVNKHDKLFMKAHITISNTLFQSHGSTTQGIFNRRFQFHNHCAGESRRILENPPKPAAKPDVTAKPYDSQEREREGQTGRERKIEGRSRDRTRSRSKRKIETAREREIDGGFETQIGH